MRRRHSKGPFRSEHDVRYGPYPSQTKYADQWWMHADNRKSISLSEVWTIVKTASKESKRERSETVREVKGNMALFTVSPDMWDLIRDLVKGRDVENCKERGAAILQRYEEEATKK